MPTLRPFLSIQQQYPSSHPYGQYQRIIEVHSWVYYEHVNVDKRITLRGINMPTLDATARGNAITLKADGIILQGFWMINSGQWPGDGSKRRWNKGTLEKTYHRE